jgi:two-component system, OmpR family, response regulator AdeR
MTDNALILIGEDEPGIAHIIAVNLERESFRTVRAGEWELALFHNLSLKPDLMLFDLNLPKKDGSGLLAGISRRCETPVILITALAQDINKPTELCVGADDYVVKPVNPAEIVARKKAVLRRLGASSRLSVMRFGQVQVALDVRAAYCPQGAERSSVILISNAFRILTHMTKFPTQASTRGDLLDVGMPVSDVLERAIDSHLSNLRKKPEAANRSPILVRAPGVGYRMAGGA